jgi:hypothetical protein
MKYLSDYGAHCIGEGIAFSAFSIAVAISGIEGLWFIVVLWACFWGPNVSIRDKKEE